MTKRAERAPSQRQLRVGEELRHALAWTLERGEVRDPGLAGVAVTVTEVRISPDLKNATAFFTPLGGGDPQPVLEGLNRARPFLRKRMAASVKLRHIPKLSFKHDESFDESSHITALLNQPRVRQDLDRSDDEESDPDEGSVYIKKAEGSNGA